MFDRGDICPGYWMNETSGVLAPVVHRYLDGSELNGSDVATMRAYLRQWIERGAWGGGDAIARLRVRVLLLDSTKAIRQWLHDAEEIGIDPL